MINHLRKTLVCSLAFFMLVSLKAEKKPLTFENMTSWESIKSRQISAKGQYVVYETSPLRGDYTTIIYQTETHQKDSLKYVKNASLSAEESFMLARLCQPYDSIRQLKIDKVPHKKWPKDSVLIYSLKEARISYTFPKVKNYKVSRLAGNYAAILLDKKAFENPMTPKDSSEHSSVRDSSLTVDTLRNEMPCDSTIKKSKKKGPEKLGDILITYNGNNGDTTAYESVTAYALAKYGQSLAFVQAYKDSLEYSEVFFLYTEDDVAVSVFKTQGTIKQLALSEDGKQLAFMYSTDTTEQKRYSLAYSQDFKQAQVLVDSTSLGMPIGWNLNPHSHLRFNKNGTRLLFGTSAIEKPAPKDSIPQDEIPGLDLWSWTDLRLQPQQLLELEKDKKKSYLALYDLKTERFYQIADETYDNATLDSEGKADYALLSNDKPYLRASNWTGRWSADIAVKELPTGKIKAVAKDILAARPSAGGKYIIWFNDKDTSLYAYDIANESTAKLHQDIPYPIYDETNDRPMVPRPYGLMGWAKNDKYLYIYDRYDIWQIDPKGQKASLCITQEYGRQNHIQLRYAELDPELTYLPQSPYLYAHNIDNNDSYYCRASLKKAQAPELLYGGAFALNSIEKASQAEKVIWSKMTVSEYPDIRFSDMDFKDIEVLSAMNPQQKDYLWATVDTTSWLSFKGERLKGLIYKPENFDPTKKYPVMIYFYERNFDTQHRYFTPSPSRSIINRTFYASNGYIVFVPDISYTNGYPGQSAYDAIVSGAQALVERYDWIDAKHMSISGQSWGGYQTAYLITQTDLFAAAMGGAVVSNMTSAYGGIRWGTGINRQFQYEKTQSRIGGNLWDKQMQYIENSPLFYAPKVNTPLLLMHNDKDTAVPWYQGIEYFMALRRLNKPVWMLNYNNEPHNLKAESIANRLDLSIRMKQFFDHYLKGTPAPEWMTKGIPAIEKGKNLAY